MNAYSITYWPPGIATAQPSLTIQADEFALEPDFVLFFKATASGKEAVLVVPRNLNPIITLTISA